MKNSSFVSPPGNRSVGFDAVILSLPQLDRPHEATGWAGALPTSRYCWPGCRTYSSFSDSQLLYSMGTVAPLSIH